MEALAAYIPMDRRQALTRGEDLPDRTNGAALFADISEFTSVTEALTRELGPRRAAEELTRQLNRVYGALIAEVHRYGGSVIGFSGDAITCWLDEDNGRRATACALALQGAMTQLGAAPTAPSELSPLGIKVAVAAGPARRFLIGHPHIQLIDVLAGVILDRIAAAEGQLRQGEVVVGAEVMAWLGNQAQVQEWRADPSGEPVLGTHIGVLLQPLSNTPAQFV